MSEHLGRIVRSTAGHDKGMWFCVVGETDACLLLANGKQRKLAAPKRKKPAHGEWAGEFSHPVLRQVREGAPVSDRALRRALAAFKEGNTLGKR